MRARVRSWLILVVAAASCGAPAPRPGPAPGSLADAGRDGATAAPVAPPAPAAPADRVRALRAALDGAREVAWLDDGGGGGGGGIGAGGPACRAWTVARVGDGAWEIQRREADGSITYGLALDGDGLALTGPTVSKRLPDGSQRVEAAGCLDTLRVGAVTGSWLEVNGERWYLSLKACEQARQRGCTGARCFAPGCR
jgi:hypothetical protein